MRTWSPTDGNATTPRESSYMVAPEARSRRDVSVPTGDSDIFRNGNGQIDQAEIFEPSALWIRRALDPNPGDVGNRRTGFIGYEHIPIEARKPGRHPGVQRRGVRSVQLKKHPNFVRRDRLDDTDHKTRQTFDWSRHDRLIPHRMGTLEAAPQVGRWL